MLSYENSQVNNLTAKATYSYLLFTLGGYLMNKTNNPIALQSKESIRKALIKAMQDSPYEEITIKHILIEAGVTRRTFYRNFDNKDDVLNSYLDEITSAFISVFANLFFKQKKRWCFTTISFLKGNKFKFVRTSIIIPAL